MSSNYQAGHSAEVRAAEYLEQQGYKIHELNWKTKYCEIDIVAQNNDAMYFVEVKYRKTDKQGYGLDYVTPKKFQQLRFAAEMWVSNHHWKNEYQLAAIGIDKDVITFVDEL